MWRNPSVLHSISKVQLHCGLKPLYQEKHGENRQKNKGVSKEKIRNYGNRSEDWGKPGCTLAEGMEAIVSFQPSKFHQLSQLENSLQSSQENFLLPAIAGPWGCGPMVPPPGGLWSPMPAGSPAMLCRSVSKPSSGTPWDGEIPPSISLDTKHSSSLQLPHPSHTQHATRSTPVPNLKQARPCTASHACSQHCPQRIVQIHICKLTQQHVSGESTRACLHLVSRHKPFLL